MAYHGFFRWGCLELVNNQRLAGYLRSGQCPVKCITMRGVATVPDTTGATAAAPALGGDTPAADNMWWVDPNAPESYGFLGLWGLQLECEEAFTAPRVTSVWPHGAIVQPQPKPAKRWTLRARAIATSECSLNYGLNAITAVMDGQTCACDTPPNYGILDVGCLTLDELTARRECTAGCPGDTWVEFLQCLPGDCPDDPLIDPRSLRRFVRWSRKSAGLKKNQYRCDCTQADIEISWVSEQPWAHSGFTGVGVCWADSAIELPSSCCCEVPDSCPVCEPIPPTRCDTTIPTFTRRRTAGCYRQPSLARVGFVGLGGTPRVGQSDLGIVLTNSGDTPVNDIEVAVFSDCPVEFTDVGPPDINGDCEAGGCASVRLMPDGTQRCFAFTGLSPDFLCYEPCERLRVPELPARTTICVDSAERTVTAFHDGCSTDGTYLLEGGRGSLFRYLSLPNCHTNACLLITARSDSADAFDATAGWWQRHPISC